MQLLRPIEDEDWAEELHSMDRGTYKDSCILLSEHPTKKE